LLNTLKDSARGCLSIRIARRASNSLFMGETNKDEFLWSSKLQEISREIALACACEKTL
jgi:hypothetical protein